MAWNGSADNGEATSRRLNKTNSPLNKRQDAASPIKKGLLAGLIVVVGGGLAAYFMLGRPGTSAPTDGRDRARPTTIAEVKPAKPKEPVVAVETNAADMVTLPDGRRVKKPKTLAEAVALVPLKPGMHRYKSVDDFFAKTNAFQIGGYKPALFKHRVEQHLSLIATRPRDMVMPPMPPLPPSAERDFENSFTRGIEIAEGEDPKDTETRVRVEEMKMKIRDYMEQDGMTFGQAYRKIETEHNRLANMTQLYKGAYRKMLINDDVDADAFRAKANAELRAAGACEFDENGKTINP